MAAADDLACAQLVHNGSNAAAGCHCQYGQASFLSRGDFHDTVLVLLGHIIDFNVVQRAPAKALLQHQAGCLGMDMHLDDITDDSHDQRVAQWLQSIAHCAFFHVGFFNDELGAVRVFQINFHLDGIGKGGFRRWQMQFARIFAAKACQTAF